MTGRSRTSKKSHKRKSSATRQTPRTGSNTSKPFYLNWRWIFSTITFLLGLIVLKPSLDITPLPPTYPDQPFAVPFRITNTSYYGLNDVSVSFTLNYVRVKNTEFGNIDFERSGWKTNRLDSGESITVISKFIKVTELPTSADISVITNYRIWWFPFVSLKNTNRFVGNFEGNWEWLPQPASGTID